MKRSLFSRLLISILSIILIGFAVVSVLIVSLVSGQFVKERREDVRGKTDSAAAYFLAHYTDSQIEDFNRYVFSNLHEAEDIIRVVADESQTYQVYILDSNGNTLITTEDGGQGLSVSVDILNDRNGKVPWLDDLGGTLKEQDMCCVRTISVGDSNVGYVLLTGPAAMISEVLSKIIKTVIVSVLWVALASLLIVFVITERVTVPLREMSKAAKSYAAGQFDVRVPVRGKDEIAELSTAFNQMANSLQNLETLRSSFISNVSHELRTPMTSIAGFIDGILSGAIPAEKQNYYLGIVSDEVRRLSRLVSSLLDISRIQAGDRKFTSTAFDICEMARQILISFEQRIEDKNLDVEFDAPDEKLMVYADRDAIYQVLFNICDNGVKFSREGGKYRIRIEKNDRRVFVSVFNEGVGIDPDELPLVFDRFYKSDKSRGVDKTGVGLGMYITKAIMDAHGQEIWVRSVRGENCEFTFTLQPLEE